jgi:hypothetical protein
MKLKPKPVVVVGDGWSALGTIGFLMTAGVEAVWIPGSGARVLAPLSGIEFGPGVAIWGELAYKLGILKEEPQVGSWIREFRNKSFREPAWAKGSTEEESTGIRNSSLWSPECQMVGIHESRWDHLTVAEIEEEIRKILLSGCYRHLKRIEGDPVSGFVVENGEVTAVKLGSGKEVHGSQIVYADQWSQIPSLEGLPKGLAFIRKRYPMGVLQASFLHEPILSGGGSQSYFSSLHRTGNNEIERRVWGHFSSDGKRSIWTLCLTSEEMEDNHEIGKKLRRLKQTLDKMFQGSDLIPEGKADFGTTISEEQVRFEEEAFFSQGVPLEEPVTLQNLSNISFLTDGYGPTRAFQQVGALLGVEVSSHSVESESEDLHPNLATTMPLNQFQ